MDSTEAQQKLATAPRTRPRKLNWTDCITFGAMATGSFIAISLGFSGHNWISITLSTIVIISSFIWLGTRLNRVNEPTLKRVKIWHTIFVVISALALYISLSASLTPPLTVQALISATPAIALGIYVVRLRKN